MTRLQPTMQSATIVRTGPREMETNRLWNWRLIVPKTIKTMLVRPLVTNFKKTVRADCAVSPSVYKSSCPLIVRGQVSIWTGVCLALACWVAGIQNKANFHFHQPGLFIGFWEASSQLGPTFRKRKGLSMFMDFQCPPKAPLPWLKPGQLSSRHLWVPGSLSW